MPISVHFLARTTAHKRRNELHWFDYATGTLYSSNQERNFPLCKALCKAHLPCRFVRKSHAIGAGLCSKRNCAMRINSEMSVDSKFVT